MNGFFILPLGSNQQDFEFSIKINKNTKFALKLQVRSQLSFKIIFVSWPLLCFKIDKKKQLMNWRVKLVCLRGERRSKIGLIKVNGKWPEQYSAVATLLLPLTDVGGGGGGWLGNLSEQN